MSSRTQWRICSFRWFVGLLVCCVTMASVSILRVSSAQSSSTVGVAPVQMVSMQVHIPILHHPVLPNRWFEPWNRAMIGTPQALAYEHIPGYTGTLYLFAPADSVSVKPRPVVIYVHGGSLEHGSAIVRNDPLSPRSWIVAHVEANLVRRGYVFVSVNYRLAPTYKWPAQIDDVNTAIRYLKYIAPQYHLDVRRFAIMGDSAGGALSSLVGLTAPYNRFEKGPWLAQSSTVAAVVDMFGPVDRRYLQETWALKHGGLPNPVFGRLTSKLVHTASAVTYVHPNSPPFLIVQGTDDSVVPPYLSTELYHKLKSNGDVAQLLLIHQSEHEFMPMGGPISPSKQSIVQHLTHFLSDVLSKAQ